MAVFNFDLRATPNQLFTDTSVQTATLSADTRPTMILDTKNCSLVQCFYKNPLDSLQRVAVLHPSDNKAAFAPLWQTGVTFFIRAYCGRGDGAAAGSMVY
jgi:hypothetical protein